MNGERELGIARAQNVKEREREREERRDGRRENVRAGCRADANCGVRGGTARNRAGMSCGTRVLSSTVESTEGGVDAA